MILKLDMEFNHSQILQDYYDLALEQKQICITSKDLLGGLGATHPCEEPLYYEVNPLLKDTYTEEVIKEVRKKYCVYRIRFMKMPSLQCYRLHTDWTPRLHVPLKTQEGAFYILDNKLYEMNEEGKLYYFNARVKHTAVNASTEDRIHLLFTLDSAYEISI